MCTRVSRNATGLMLQMPGQQMQHSLSSTSGDVQIPARPLPHMCRSPSHPSPSIRPPPPQRMSALRLACCYSCTLPVSNSHWKVVSLPTAQHYSTAACAMAGMICSQLVAQIAAMCQALGLIRSFFALLAYGCLVGLCSLTLEVRPWDRFALPVHTNWFVSHNGQKVVSCSGGPGLGMGRVDCTQHIYAIAVAKPVPQGSTRLASTRLASTRPASTRLASTRLASTRLAPCTCSNLVLCRPAWSTQTCGFSFSMVVNLTVWHHSIWLP